MEMGKTDTYTKAPSSNVTQSDLTAEMSLVCAEVILVVTPPPTGDCADATDADHDPVVTGGIRFPLMKESDRFEVFSNNIGSFLRICGPKPAYNNENRIELLQ